MKTMLCRALALSVLTACLPAPARAAGPGPERVVSMNLCADELVLRLADPAQVAAVTYFARDPRGSTVAAKPPACLSPAASRKRSWRSGPTSSSRAPSPPA